MTHTSKTFYFKNIMAIHGERERHPYAGWEKASPIYRQKGNPQTGDNLQFLDSQAGKRLISAPRRLLRRYDLRVFRGGWKVPPIWENQQKYGYPIHQTMPRIASRASFRPYQITFQDSFGLYQITFQTTYYIPPGDCRRRTAWLIFFILKKTHPSLLFMSMSWIGKNLQLAHLETQLASLRC